MKRFKCANVGGHTSTEPLSIPNWLSKGNRLNNIADSYEHGNCKIGLDCSVNVAGISVSYLTFIFVH